MAATVGDRKLGAESQGRDELRRMPGVEEYYRETYGDDAADAFDARTS
jgi:hypothetical protein